MRHGIERNQLLYRIFVILHRYEPMNTKLFAIARHIHIFEFLVLVLGMSTARLVLQIVCVTNLLVLHELMCGQLLPVFDAQVIYDYVENSEEDLVSISLEKLLQEQVILMVCERGL